MSPRSALRRAIVAVLLGSGVTAALLAPSPASAHGFSSVVYADASSAPDGAVRTVLSLEYALLVVSTADLEKVPALYDEGMPAFDAADEIGEAKALNDHAAEIERYVDGRFTVSAGGQPCTPTRTGPLEIRDRDGVPYATLTLDHSCPHSATHDIRSTLFPDAEGYVADTVTVVTYDLDGQRGSAALDPTSTVFSTEEALLPRLGTFFVLGVEHLLFGIDHILFLLALIVSSRHLRDILLAATSFTVAHSVTFILAGLGIVSAPAEVVEPIIALSIAVVAGFYVWQVVRDRSAVPGSPPRSPMRGGDRARLAVVFGFGLIHGLGFASALGIDEPFSWPLLLSLLVFNVGIETVQIAIIAVAFPLLVLLRRSRPRLALAVGGILAAAVTVTGLVWFVERVVPSVQQVLSLG
ncbi:HupE/UreJ family protein [Naasia aerilata]|uniref:HupE / UreJ protein n=1 Tax=Naasia aerilata TaxID=1162966 RepID=A0ABM8GGI1_9MICO|nr:HupE/UreJ family protein [Naasia aerilata]BDZ47453.1 hypothetical protein GCM10025866_33620 [Naasia aerilata]